MSKIKFNKFNILLIIRIMINHKIRIFQILLFNKQIICIRIINKFRHRILKILRILQINNPHIKIKLIVMISNKLVKFKRFLIFRKEDVEDLKNRMKYIFML